MDNCESKLKKYISEHNIRAEHLRFEKSLHSVQELLRVTGLPLEEITKTIIFTGGDNGERTHEMRQSAVAAMIPAMFRVSASRLKEAVGFDVEIAMPKEALERTGYPVGGMPCFGYDAMLIVDPKVLDREYVYTGGGSEFSIIKMATSEILKFSPIIKRVTGKKSN
ncbi:MAG: hypothetical protein A2787_10195 [Omnitrophica WOR_2 bacterium RIFCSPHIGHO2_01_FULL_48_9]|nr:MAG: hypothetical protein A2787_10195 [Omnitrophica WOR_2 bacterium RIFCSPHIGHO2_01_FULL_48_9]